MRKKFLLTAFLAATTVLTVSSPAMAWRAQETTLRSVNGKLSDLNRVLRDFHTSTIEAMMLSTGENSSYIDKSIEAQKRFLDGSNQNASMLARQQARAAAESGMFDPDPNACLIVDLLLGGSQGQGGAEAQGTQAVASVMNDITGGSDAVRRGPAAAAAEVINKSRPLTVDGMSINDATVDLRYFGTNSTLDLDNPDIRMAYEGALRNLIAPVPDRPVTAAEMQADAAAMVRAASQQGTNARRSLAAEVFAMTANMKDPQTDSQPFKNMLEEAKVTYNRTMTDQISEMTQLEALVLATYATPNPKSTNQGIVLQEIRRLLELQNRMKYISLELQMRQAEVQAATLLATIDSNAQN